MKIRFFAFIGIANVSLLLQATDSTWINPGGGDWLNALNWSAGVPNSDGDTARFSHSGFSGDINIGLSAPVRTQFLFIDSAANYTIGPANGLTFENDVGPSVLEIDTTNGTGSQTISCGVTVNSLFAPKELLINQNSSSTFTISGNIGEIGVNVVGYNGPGVMVLSGNNTIANLQLNGGTVSVSSQANLGSTVNPLPFFNNAVLLTTDSFTMSRNLTIGAGGGTINTDSGTTLTLTGNINTVAANNFFKDGGGVLEIDGTTLLGGAVEVVNGELRVNTLLQSFGAGGVLIDSSGILSGANSTIHFNVTNNGTLSPGSGSTPGTMTILGDLTQSSTGLLAISYLDPSHFSQLLLPVNTANIAGSSLEIIIAPHANVVLNQKFKILEAFALNGQFANVFTNSPFFLATAVYNDPSVGIIFTMAPPTMSPGLAQAIMAAQATTLANANQSANRAGTAVTQLHNRIEGRDHAACNVSSGSSFRRRSGLHEIDLASLSRPKRPDIVLASNSAILAAKKDHEAETKEEELKQRIALPPPVPPGYHPGRFYIGPTVSFGGLDRIHYSMWGAEVGFDYVFREFGIGLLSDYSHCQGKGFNTDEVSMTFYSTYVPHSFPQLSVDVILGGAYDWYLFKTHTETFTGIQTVRGTPNGTEYNATFGMEYSFNDSQFTSMADNLQFMPAVNIEFVKERIDGYREHGAGEFDLRLKRSTLKFLLLTVEGKMGYSVDWENISLIPLIYLGWQRDLLHEKNISEFRFASTEDDFTKSKLKRLGRNYAIAGADVAVYFYKKYGVEVSYDYQWNKGFYSNKFFLGFDYLF